MLKKIKILSITKKKYIGKMYNLAVEKDETYIADGIIVHNCRSRVRSMSEGQVGRRGLKVGKVTSKMNKSVGEGFLKPPTAKFEPDLKKYSPKIKEQLKKDIK